MNAAEAEAVLERALQLEATYGEFMREQVRRFDARRGEQIARQREEDIRRLEESGYLRPAGGVISRVTDGAFSVW